MNLRYKKPLRINFIKLRKSISLKTVKSPLQFGFYGLQFSSTNLLTFKQINTIRIKISRSLKTVIKRFYKIYLRIFFQHSVTSKPTLSRMGKGSGPISGWLGIGKKGHVFLELNTIALSFNIKAILLQGIQCMPINYIVIKRSLS